MGVSFFSSFLMQSGNWKRGSRLREHSICATMKTSAADIEAGGSKLLYVIGKITEQSFRLSGLTSVPGGPGGPGGPLGKKKGGSERGEELFK